MRRHAWTSVPLAIFLAFIPAACGSSAPDEEFCGSSTQGACSADADCYASGCNGEVCQSSAEDPVVSACVVLACNDPDPYGLRCGCVGGQCRWAEWDDS